jgi:hypothetical protein
VESHLDDEEESILVSVEEEVYEITMSSRLQLNDLCK